MESNEIIKLFFSRNEKAISAVSEKYTAYCTKIAMNILDSREDSEECVNDAFLKAWELIPPNHPQQLSAFLGKLTRNLAINRYRMQCAEKRRGSKTALILDELSEVIPSDSAIETEPEYKELINEINVFLKKLPLLKRNIFIRRYWYCDSVKEIALINGLTQSNVSVILNRIRKKLKKHLEKKGMI